MPSSQTPRNFGLSILKINKTIFISLKNNYLFSRSSLAWREPGISFGALDMIVKKDFVKHELHGEGYRVQSRVHRCYTQCNISSNIIMCLNSQQLWFSPQGQDYAHQCFIMNGAGTLLEELAAANGFLHFFNDAAMDKFLRHQ